MSEFRTPTQTTAPVADTTAGLWTFGTPASHVIITNTSGQTINVRLNSASAAAATMGSHDLIIANAGQLVIKASDYGLHKIKTVGVWFPAAATVGNFNIRGI